LGENVYFVWGKMYICLDFLGDLWYNISQYEQQGDMHSWLVICAAEKAVSIFSALSVIN
jgi:hypothetical protein